MAHLRLRVPGGRGDPCRNGAILRLMEPTRTIQFEVTRDDLVALALYRQDVSPGEQRRRILRGAVPFILGMIAALIADRKGGDEDDVGPLARRSALRGQRVWTGDPAQRLRTPRCSAPGVWDAGRVGRVCRSGSRLLGRGGQAGEIGVRLKPDKACRRGPQIA